MHCKRLEPGAPLLEPVSRCIALFAATRGVLVDTILSVHHNKLKPKLESESFSQASSRD